MGWEPGGWTALTRVDMWPGIATPLLMTRIGGSCFLFGGLLVVLMTSLAPSSFTDTSVQCGNAAVAGVVGLTVLLWGERLRLWQFHLMVLTATLQITVSVYESANPSVAVSFATLYVFIACAAFFVAWPAAALQLGAALVCCTTAMAMTSTVPWWSGLVASGTTVAIGIVIAILGRLVFDAELDDVTGLLNRRGFDRLLGFAVRRARSGGLRPAVVFVCVDGYGAIHEQFGGGVADEVMQEIVAAWRNTLEPDHVLARRGADEFTVLLPNGTDQQAVSLTHRLRDAVSTGCSAGVTTWQPGESVSVVVARADTALRRAKRSGRNRTMLESANLPPVAVELSDALAAEALDVRYQPVVALSDGDLVGIEALLRWSPPSRPDLSPYEVIRVAEENNLIAALDHYVLRRACLDAQRIRSDALHSSMWLSVNVSGLELVQKGYAKQVFDTLAETGWPAERLVLEVTESVVDVDRPSALEALTALRRGGVKVAVDDFGTGYSSLSRLQAVPTDFLKLDASFVAVVTPTSCEPTPLLRAVAALADALHLTVIAEGVETPQQASVLRRLGIEFAQGFYFGKAQRPAELLDVMAPAPSWRPNLLR
ncbi:putative bifunctional diguanylate cyclase/phosphodiesterase [Mycolicibacterium sp. GCM10028919]|uniref:putative bifunctional diguanylate cyclase/phosphodiesterase n=1 Tax=Mycolicibacterium sp. GCM10028919 TaxID=3273401 RepID=UPI003611082F